ncbi:MAG TPA: DNA mismatch repair endonuclease MutL, partial [Longimicrobiales bacterium]|nr:DNA mismatch repair endonuclease MutL [Longimicrobiales bacterium]
MSRKIQVLPDRVANQIAAGEVVERPASVVKELVENALDAAATRVDVALERGGKRRIRVADDGVGMSREDALLSLDRHATSKIREADDLRRVETFGFRGEALPSIAAVSRMTLETRAAGEEVGTRVRVNGGTIGSVEDAARRRGTTVDVERLFFNAPARAKFLKSVGAETRAVSDSVTALALANPSVSFSLASDDRTLLEVAGAPDLVGRVAALWGDEEAGALIPVSGEAGDLRLRGLIQRPDAADPGFRRAHLFVNGRPFGAPALLKAADRGYRTTVAPGVRPWLFLYLQARAGSVDVNVHPAKAEVRFRDSAAVEELIESSVRRALTGEESAATLDAQVAPPRMAVRERRSGGEEEGESGDAESQMALFLSRGPGEGTNGGVGETEAEGPEPGEAVEAPPDGRPRLFQVHDTYIVAESRDGLLLIDQHSAHERVLFERLMRRFEDGGGGGQRLLFPLTLRLSGPEFARVEELSGLLARAGFEVEGFGGDTVIVHSVPNPHPYFDAEQCFREMVDELTRGSELVRSARNQHERIAKTFACKGAIKAGQRLSQDEMRELFDQLFATEL